MGGVRAFVTGLPPSALHGESATCLGRSPTVSQRGAAAVRLQTSKTHAASLCGKVNPKQASKTGPPSDIAENGDTIYLATILFLIGISGHFRFFRIRLGLVILGGLMLIVALIQIGLSPPIP